MNIVLYDITDAPRILQFHTSAFPYLLGYRRCTVLALALVYNVQRSALSTHPRKYSDSHRITVEACDTHVNIAPDLPSAFTRETTGTIFSFLILILLWQGPSTTECVARSCHATY